MNNNGRPFILFVAAFTIGKWGQLKKKILTNNAMQHDKILWVTCPTYTERAI